MKRVAISLIAMLVIYVFAMVVVKATMHPDTWGFFRVCVIIADAIMGYGIYKEEYINE